MPPKSRKTTQTLDQLWADIGDPLRNILRKIGDGLTPVEYMGLFTKIYDFISSDTNPAPAGGSGRQAGAKAGSASTGNQGLYEHIEALLIEQAGEVVKNVRAQPDDAGMLQYFARRWEEWTGVTRMLSHLLNYLDRAWVKTRRSPNILELGVLPNFVWKEHVLTGGLKEQLPRAMISLVTADRNGDGIQDHLIRNCVDCFCRMGLSRDNPRVALLTVYQTQFEAPFIEETKTYYRAESARILSTDNVLTYIGKARARIDEERNRVRRYLHESTRETLEKHLVDTLVRAHLELLQQQFPLILAHDSAENLQQLYEMVLLAPEGIAPLLEMFTTHITQEGRRALAEDAEAASKPEVFVEILLRVYHRYTRLITDALHDDPSFVESRNKAFRAFIEDNAVTGQAGAAPAGSSGGGKAGIPAPQLLAKYCDLMLHRGTTLSGEAMEQRQRDIVDLFRYFPDKDMFMRAYQQLLSRRLIQDRTAGDDVEEAMIAKLKEAQGFEYCSKLQRMMQDMKTSRDTDAGFKAHCAQKGHTGLTFDFSVLTAGTWPFNAPQTAFRVPDEVDLMIRMATDYYVALYQGRRLTFAHNISRAEIRTGKGHGRYEFMSTAYQAGIILTFNDREGKVPLRDIQGSTLLQDTPLKQGLWPMVKLRILACSDGNKIDSWHDETTFEVNPKFASQKRVFSIVPIGAGVGKTAAQETSAERAREDQDLMRDRDAKLGAAIVRVMKARKTLANTELIQQTITQVSKWFSPTIPMIKKAIETLIEGGYIKRGEDLKTFEYIA